MQQAMAVPSQLPGIAALDLIKAGKEEVSEVARFYREAGYPVPIQPEDTCWGAWDGPVLVGALALCREGGIRILRGPEVAHAYRRRGVGKALLRLAAPEVARDTTYCISYGFLKRLHAAGGFRAVPPGDAPEFLWRRVSVLNAQDWDVVLLRREAG